MSDYVIPYLPTYPIAYQIDEVWADNLIRALEQRDREVNNTLVIHEITGSFAIDSTGVKTVTMNYEFGFTPEGVEHCQVSVYEITNVDDWGFDLLKIESISATQVVVKVNVSTASATGSATAGVAVWVRP